MIVYLNFARCYRNEKNFHIFSNKILNCWPKKPKDKILIFLKTLQKTLFHHLGGQLPTLLSDPMALGSKIFFSQVL